jgi:hypothetical protein
MVITIGTKFGHPNFDIKGSIIHSVFPFFKKYCYVTKICINFLLVKMKGNINKETVEKMKKKESLGLEPNGS